MTTETIAPAFIYRVAGTADIPQMQVVRNAVRENMLSNPDLVKDADYVPFLDEKGRGWVCLHNDTVVGFAIVDMETENVWALFVTPDFDRQGIGRELHRQMLDWYFGQDKQWLWLGTAPGTRAERFYHLQGWKETGLHGKETKFEMTGDQWKERHNTAVRQ